MYYFVRSRSAHVFVCLVAFLLMSPAPQNHTTRRSVAHAPQSGSGAWHPQPQASQRDVPAELHAAIEAALYRLEPDVLSKGEAGYQAPNPAQGWRARFGTEGLSIETRSVGGREASKRFTMRLAAYGYGERSAPVERAEMVATKNRLEYRRGSLVEWYLNERRGVEQGFTLRQPPASGVERARGEALTLRLAIGGSLRAELSADAQSVKFLDAAGTHTLNYDQLTAFDASGRELPARMRVEGREVRLEVDDAGAQYPLTIDPFIQQQKVQASNAVPGDSFGGSVSVSGDTAIIGAEWDDNSGGQDAGTAYIFTRSNGVWTEQQRLQAADAAAGDFFGVSVSVSGNTAVVGANGDNTGPGSYAGSAYVFVRSGTTWTQQQRLLPSVPGDGDHFGVSVYVDGDTVIAGSPVDDNPAGRDAGSAYIFVRSGSTWTQQQRLQASDAVMGDFLGGSVALSHDTAIVGATGSDHSGGVEVGSAYIFVRSNGVWTQQGRLRASDAAEADFFGNAVAISGDTAIVASRQDDNSAGREAGSAYIFVRNNGVWTQQQRLQAADASFLDLFGDAVAISGDTAIVSAEEDFNSGGLHSGSAYIFTRSNGVWTQQQRLQAADAVPHTRFGSGLSISGDTLLVGAPGALNSVGERVGAGYVFINPSLVAPVIISEFRLSGPGAGGGGLGSDEFIELYNNSDAAITIASVDDSAGWTLRSSDGTLNLTIPNGDIIPARGHYLVTNPVGYSLADYPTSTHGAGGAFGNRTYANDVSENLGIALFRSTNVINLTAANRLDAVGSTGEANPLYKEGTGYTPLAGATGAAQYSFVRDLADGRPKDTGDNASDFILVSVTGMVGSTPARLGAPAPQNTDSPIQRNASIKASLIDGMQPSSASPNRVRSGAADATEPANSTRGTLKIRRRFTNTTGQSVTRLRFRVVEITTLPRPDNSTADLRVLPNSGGSVTLSNGTVVTLTDLTREEPPLQSAHGGGFNTTLSATLAQAIPNNTSIEVEFNLGVIEDGNFRFMVNVEALNTPQTHPPANAKTGTPGKAAKSGTGRATP